MLKEQNEKAGNSSEVIVKQRVDCPINPRSEDLMALLGDDWLQR
jgi:hypothetical protein